LINICQLVVWIIVQTRLQEDHTFVILANQNEVSARIGGSRNIKPINMHVIKILTDVGGYPLLKIEIHVAGV
tara:strand:- start:659 stop:874 length:216 start_codon:yes stop_codon:yes gene_type:complete